VLFCDGELDASGIGSSVVLNWDRLKAGTQSSGLLVCRGSMELYYLGFTTVLAYGELKVRKSTMDTRFLEPKDDPFAWLKIFDPSDIGLDVKQAKTELHITGVKNQSPFGKAGLEPGDVIASANGNPMTDYHALRRLIRRAYVEETAVSLAVRRQGKPINLKVDFKKPAS
jgi:predicted metalloprotease with PDZ domain